MKLLEKTGSTVVREMHTKIVGVSAEDRQKNVQKLQEGQGLVLCHEEENPFDTNALKLFADKECTQTIGYIGRDIAADMVRQMAEYQYSYGVTVHKVTGGKGRTYGVNITITAYT